LPALSWLDLLGAIPTVPGLTWTATIRLARLNRAVRIIKHLQGKDRDEFIDEARQTPAKTTLLTMIITTFVLITVASLLILRLEKGINRSNYPDRTGCFLVGVGNSNNGWIW
jgi:hypothetical protein